ncbi:hypothetical protein GH714_006339 [Hevea brasiliensis]|uniref:Ubiquitin-like domain-containing protein n=1 Tax=Hevea brasiliensis TaxID=3981 RepID=A0A6A6L1A6_HEVBR|nr:hypothetical protein GH714_006339 [Hevea brasiliensis]
MENRKSDSIRFSVLLPNGKDLLRRCFESKTLVKAIHKAILWDCKIPVTEQKLYYKGEHLQRWQTLEDYSIQNDDCLELKLGFDETSDDWITIDELLAIETKEESENLMSSYSVPATLVMLYSSAIPEYKDYASALIRFSMEKISNCPNVSVDRCIHLALEFCYGHSEVDGDPLYQPWRTTLKQLLERDIAKEEDKFIVDLLSTQIKVVFSCLLNKMESNLRLIPETARILETSGWLHSVSIVYLDILKEINSISQLWENEKKQFQHVLMNQQISLQLILEKTTRKDDYHWLLEHNDVIDSKSRMHLVTMMMIPEENYSMLSSASHSFTGLDF